MRRQTLTLILITILAVPAIGQSMTLIFRNLPAEYTPELSKKEKEILLQNGSYVIVGGDSMEATKYTIDTTEFPDYLSYEFGFTTGQRGFIDFELRKFEQSDGNVIVVFSRCGGLARSYYQQDLKIFTIQNDTLIENASQSLLPTTITMDDFLKKATPDSVRLRMEKAVSSCYDLYPVTKNEIDFRITLEYNVDKDEQWIIALSMTFNWNGTSFDRKLRNKE